MPASVSIREYIRWPPQPAGEPTSTVVLTSPGRHFVDLRILKPVSDESTETSAPIEGIQPLSRLDWAFAGTSSTRNSAPGSTRPPNPDLNSHPHPNPSSNVAPVPNPTSQQSTLIPSHLKSHPRLHAKWQHTLDSRTLEPENVVDEGEIIPLPGGERTLEYGRMVNPSTGRVQEYEEAWRDEGPLPARRLAGEGEEGREGEKGEEGDGVGEAEGGKVACVVLVLPDEHPGRHRGMVVRVGRWCQGIIRVGEAVSLERWEWKVEDAEWKRTVRMGDVWVPCGVAMDTSRMRLGGEVRYGEQVWEVVELTEGD